MQAFKSPRRANFLHKTSPGDSTAGREKFGHSSLLSRLWRPRRFSAKAPTLLQPPPTEQQIHVQKHKAVSQDREDIIRTEIRPRNPTPDSSPTILEQPRGEVVLAAYYDDTRPESRGDFIIHAITTDSTNHDARPGTSMTVTSQDTISTTFFMGHGNDSFLRSPTSLNTILNPAPIMSPTIRCDGIPMVELDLLDSPVSPTFRFDDVAPDSLYSPLSPKDQPMFHVKSPFASENDAESLLTPPDSAFSDASGSDCMGPVGRRGTFGPGELYKATKIAVVSS